MTARVLPRFLVLLLAVPLWGTLSSSGCAGGETGTGLTTTEGNVSDSGSDAGLPRRDSSATFFAWFGGLLVTAAANAVNGIEGIDVVIEGTASRDRTDENGRFSLRGDFFGPVSLRFERFEDRVFGRMPVDVPRGGLMRLVNVRIDSAAGEATAERREVSFEGVLDEADCLNEEIEIFSRFDSARRNFTVELGGATLRDADGASLECTDLERGDRLDVEGVVQDDGAIGEATIERRDE